jgi:hypothetical protein
MKYSSFNINQFTPKSRSSISAAVSGLTFVLIAFISGILPSAILAQNHQEHVSIVGSYRPVLAEFSKININPEIETSEFSMGEITLNQTDTVLASNIELELITPINLKTDDTKSGYSSFLKAGIGSRISPLFVFRHNTSLSKKTRFGLGISHFSSWMNMPEFAPSSLMNSEFSASLDNNTKTYIIESKVYYRQQMNHYYGFDPDEYAGLYSDVESIKQNYQTFGIETSLRSLEGKGNNRPHEISAEYSMFSAKFGSKEHKASLSGKVENYIDWLSTDDQQTLLLNVDLQTFFNSDSVQSKNNFQLNLIPAFRLAGDFYLLSVGANLALHSDVRSEVHLYPAITSGLFVFDKKLKFYASLEGSSQKIDYQHLVDENPFVSPVLPLKWLHNNLDFSAGVKVFALKSLDIHLGMRYLEMQDAAFFVTDTAASFNNQFTLLYDDATLFNLNAEAAVRLPFGVNVHALYVYNQYTTSHLSYAYYKPSHSFTLSGNYALNKVLSFSTTIYYVGQRIAATYEYGILKNHTMNSYIDLNAGTDLKINDSFVVFAEISNLLNWQYDRFYNYPVHGVELFAGIKMRF